MVSNISVALEEQQWPYSSHCLCKVCSESIDEYKFCFRHHNVLLPIMRMGRHGYLESCGGFVIAMVNPGIKFVVVSINVLTGVIWERKVKWNCNCRYGELQCNKYGWHIYIWHINDKYYNTILLLENMFSFDDMMFEI